MTNYNYETKIMDHRVEALRMAIQTVNHPSFQLPANHSLQAKILELAASFSEFITLSQQRQTTENEGAPGHGTPWKKKGPTAPGITRISGGGGSLTEGHTDLSQIPRNNNNIERSVQTVPESEWAARLAGIRKMAESPLSIYNKNHPARPENRLPSELFAANEGKWGDSPIVTGVDLVGVANPDEPIDIGDNILPAPKTPRGEIDLGPGKLVTGKNIMDSEGETPAMLPKPVENPPSLTIPRDNAQQLKKALDAADAYATALNSMKKQQSGTMDDDVRSWVLSWPMMTMTEDKVVAPWQNTTPGPWGVDDSRPMIVDDDMDKSIKLTMAANRESIVGHNDPYQPNRMRNSR